MTNQENKPEEETAEENAAPEEETAEAEADAEQAAEQEAEEAAGAEESGAKTYEDLQKEAASLKDQLMRSLAEAENLRRRMEREKKDISKYAIANFAREVLGVADNLNRAIGAVDENARTDNEDLHNLLVGIEMTERSLANACEQVGVKPIEALGKRFDHNFHQAMFEVEDPSQPAGLVVQEMQKGYMIHDRLLRPAMVGVSKGGPKLEEVPAEEATDPAAAESSGGDTSAYEKASDAAGGPKVDKEL